MTSSLADTLLWLCSIPSPIGEEGPLCDAMVTRLAHVATAAPLRRYGNSLVVPLTRGRGGPRITLAGHLDVVRTIHDQPPRIEGDKLYGPGAADMKAGLAVMLALAAAPPPSVCDLTLVFYAREEGPYEENELGAVLDQDPDLRQQDLAVCLEPSDNELQLGCNGSLHVRVTFRGRTAHSSRPWQGDNAIHRAAPLLARLAALAPIEFRDGHLVYQTVTSATTAEGGRGRNIVPDIFSLNLNHRFTPNTSVAQAMEDVRSLVGPEADITFTDVSPSAPTVADHPLVTLLAQSGVTGVAPKQAWTDVARFAQLGVPAVNFGPGVNAQAHQRNEWTQLPLLDQSLTIFRRFLTSIAAMSLALLALLAFGTTACRTVPSGGDRAAPRPTDVVPMMLISVDGLRPDYVLEADKHGLRIPELRRLVREGSFSKGVRGVVPTVTYPSHTTMLTGVSPAKHGILANTTFDPMEQNLGGWHWYARDIRVPTLGEAATRSGLVTASFFWPVNVGTPMTYTVAEYWRAMPDDDKKLVKALSTPNLIDELETALGTTFPHGRDWGIEADELRTRFALRFLAIKRPFFTTIHLLSLDTEQHAAGPFSPRAFAALERLDATIGSLRGAAEALSGGKAVLCVVSDHGFVNVNQEVNLKSALREAGLITVDERTAAVTSWRATAWIAGGSAAVVLHDPRDENLRAETERTLRRLAENPANGIRRIVNEEQLRMMGGFSGATFLVELKPGHMFGNALRGPIVVGNKAGEHIAYQGMHGYLPDESAMNASFFLAGPGVPAGRVLENMDLRDIAPTLAPLLRVTLPTAEGKNVLADR